MWRSRGSQDDELLTLVVNHAHSRFTSSHVWSIVGLHTEASGLSSLQDAAQTTDCWFLSLEVEPHSASATHVSPAPQHTLCVRLPRPPTFYTYPFASQHCSKPHTTPMLAAAHRAAKQLHSQAQQTIGLDKTLEDDNDEVCERTGTNRLVGSLHIAHSTRDCGHTSFVVSGGACSSSASAGAH